jgi:hypothetical protein
MATTRRRGKGSAASPKVDVDVARLFAMERLGGAEVTQKFGNASFSISGKVFAFTRPDGLVLKLPADILAQVLAEREAGDLVMGKRVMREWVLLRMKDAEGYRDELDLLRAAMDFVGRK